VNPERTNGVGGGFVLGYGFTDWITVYLNGDGRESHEDRHLAHADIGVEVFFPGERRVRPHIGVALIGVRAEFDAGSQTIDARGAGWSVGGVLYFLSSSIAFDATLRLHARGTCAVQGRRPPQRR
jgi:hypothetical protein